MTLLVDTTTHVQKRSDIQQFNLVTILFMFAWPAAWYMLLIYGLARPLTPPDGVVPTWLFLLLIVLGAGAEGLVGLLLLRREGYRLSITALRNRIRWQWPQGRKAWIIALLVLVAGLILSMAAGPLNAALAHIPGFAPPSWWPAASNPLVEVNSAADFFPDIHLEGNWGFVILYFFIGLVCNVFGEEIYYRGYLLPRMHGVFGRWDWVANGIGFTLKHVYQRWLYPGVLVGGL
ncbi:MAG: CPBP family glutamic-type intramembrane protease, partial [Anaerolineae bacterium]